MPAHIARAIEEELDEGAAMTLVLDVKSRDPNTGSIPTGDFDRSEKFRSLGGEFWRPLRACLRAEGVAGTDRDLLPHQGNGPRRISLLAVERQLEAFEPASHPHRESGRSLALPPSKGNRELHVVVKNDTLAKRFRNHIKADYDRSLALGGQTEAVEDEIMIDVPVEILEAVEFEAAPARVLQPLKINRRVRVKPLLTPDKKGAVYSNAVLRLIRSATRQLPFQNQYIGMKGADSGFLKQLVHAMAQKAQTGRRFPKNTQERKR